MSQLSSKLKLNGIALVESIHTSIFETTDNRMYNFLPVNISLLKQTSMFGANFIAMIETKDIFEYILQPWVYCSLIRDCIAPLGSTLQCNFNNMQNMHSANCHRYDQSVLNVLLAHYFNGNSNIYHNKGTCVSTERYATSYFHLQRC